MSPKIFAIIVNWNGEKDTLVCLESLLKSTYDNLHIVISDNGSRKESLEVINNWLAIHPVQNGIGGGIKSVVVIENGKNLGFTGANTVGILHSMKNDADYFLFLNNDAIATPNFLIRMVEAGERDPKVGIIGCKIFYADEDPGGRHKIWSLGGYSFIKGIPINIATGEYDKPEWKGTQAQPLINGCCMLIKREVVETIGVQDDALFFGIDDVEYSFRASRHGWRNIVVYDSSIYHAASQSVVPRSGLQVYYLFRNVLMFRSKYFPWYRNLLFYMFFTIRYVIFACMYRYFTGRSRVNIGVYWAIVDFINNKSGECSHSSLKPIAD
jgi:GT2 family glycosyltransferase